FSFRLRFPSVWLERPSVIGTENLQSTGARRSCAGSPCPCTKGVARCSGTRMNRRPGLRRKPQAHSYRPRREVLEGRTLPSILRVTNTSDTGVSGDGSLRGEIAAARSGSTIEFASSVQGMTIHPPEQWGVNSGQEPNLADHGPRSETGRS